MKGFTLIEVVVVIVLLAVIGAVVTPTVLRPDEGDLMASARRVMSVIRSARMAGLRQGAPVVLTVDAANGRYMTELERDGTMEHLDGGQLHLSPNVTVLGDRQIVKFAFDGTGSAFAESLIVAGNGGAMLVGVEGWTGEPFLRTTRR